MASKGWRSTISSAAARVGSELADVTVALEQSPHRFAHIQVIVNDKYAGLHGPLP